MFDQNPDLEAWPVPKNKNWSKSGFWANIDDFLELYRKNKTENRKSGSNKFLGIPKAIQNRSKHSLRVLELSTPLAWSYRHFRKFQDFDKILKFSILWGEILDFHRKIFLAVFFFWKIFLTPKKNIFLRSWKKNRDITSMQKIVSFRLVRFSERFRHSAAS